MRPVLLASHTSNLGGAELSLLETASALQDDGVPLLLVLPDARGGLPSAARRRGLATHVIPSHWRFVDLGSDHFEPSERSDVLEWSEFLADVQPQAVISNTLTLAGPIAAAQSLGFRSLVWVHGVIPGSTLSSMSAPVADWRRRESAILRAADEVVFCSPMAAEYFGWGSHDALVVRNPVAVRPPVVDLDSHHAFLHAGVFEANKNQLLAVDAFSLVLEEAPEARLILCGKSDTAYGRRVRQRIATLGLERSVSTPGHVDDLDALRRTTLATLVTSDLESASRTALESLAVGIPVISTNCIGPSDFIESGRSGGFLTDHSARELADAMLQVWRDRTFAAELGRRGREVVRTRHAPSLVSQQWREILRDVRPRPTIPLHPDLPGGGQDGAPASPIQIDRGRRASTWIECEEAPDQPEAATASSPNPRWDLPFGDETMTVVVTVPGGAPTDVTVAMMDPRLANRPLRRETLRIEPGKGQLVTVRRAFAASRDALVRLRLESEGGIGITVSTNPAIREK